MSTGPKLTREAERAVEAAREHPARAKVAGFCFDLLSRQAEGRTLLSGKKLVKARLAERDLTETEADSEAGNPVSILARGPQSAGEHALVSAFAVSGLGAVLDDLEGDARSEHLERFARHLEWLETATEYRLGPLLEPLLSPSLVEALYGTVGQRMRRDDAELATPAVRARQAVRLSLLADSSLGGARVELRRALDALTDPMVRAAAAAALGLSAPPAAAPRVLHGRPGRLPAARPLATLRWLSGWALLAWLGRAAAYLIGLRRSAELELKQDSLILRGTTTLLGRVVRRSEEMHPLARLEAALRQVRYPALPLLLGVVCFAVGLLGGGWLMADGLRAGYGPLIGLAAVVLLGGALLDLVLDVFAAGRRGRVVLELRLGRQRLSLSGVPLAEADALLCELARRVD